MADVIARTETEERIVEHDPVVGSVTLYATSSPTQSFRDAEILRGDSLKCIGPSPAVDMTIGLDRGCCIVCKCSGPDSGPSCPHQRGIHSSLQDFGGILQVRWWWHVLAEVPHRASWNLHTSVPHLVEWFQFSSELNGFFSRLCNTDRISNIQVVADTEYI